MGEHRGISLFTSLFKGKYREPIGENRGISLLKALFKGKYRETIGEKGIIQWFSLEFPRDLYGFFKEFPFSIDCIVNGRLKGRIPIL